MLDAACWLSLLLFAVALSQPLFYWMALGQATRQLSAAAYVELRQQVNLAIEQRLIRLYIAALVSLLLMLGCSLVAHRWALATGAVVAILSLVGDLILAVRLNVPINKRMDGWSLASIPDDWQDQRVLWDSALGIRRIVMLVGFATLASVITAA
jgi:hypothetical protein